METPPPTTHRFPDLFPGEVVARRFEVFDLAYPTVILRAVLKGSQRRILVKLIFWWITVTGLQSHTTTYYYYYYYYSYYYYYYN